MGFTCAVAECPNSKRVKKERGTDLIFHRFPVKNNAICKVWLTKCHRGEKIKAANSTICSDHFIASDYEDDMRNRLLGLPMKKILRSSAVPSVFPERSKPVVETDRGNRNEKRIRKLIVDSVIGSTSASSTNADADQDIIESSNSVVSDQESKTSVHQIENSTKLAEQMAVIEAQQMKLEKLREENRDLKDKLKNSKLQNAEIRKKWSDAELKLTRANFSKLKSKYLGRNHFPEIFSKPQLRRLSGKKVNWSKEDIVKALALRSMSLKSYKTAKTVWKIPLPSVRTLQRWASLFTCEPGLLHDVIQVLKHCGDSMDTVEKICIISYDEMNTDSSYVLDPTFDRVLSSAKAQVLMARGIYSKWKQPVSYYFDTDVNAGLMFDLIRSLESCSFPVHAVVSDLSSTNRGFWKQLGINEYNCYFINPAQTNRKVHVFGDVPHCLKNLRNHLLDDPLYLEDGTVITIEDLNYLVSRNGEELKLAPKLSRKHLEVIGAERMRVRPAAQLLSHHTASLAKFFIEDQPSISEFFDTINNGFDVLNSRVPVDKKNSMKSGFSLKNEAQVNAVKKLRSLMTKMRFQSKKTGNISPTLLPFQVGFIISINSLLELAADLSFRYGIKYILTSRLNQDALESLFSIIRSFGGSNTNPNAVEFRFRIRMVLLGSKIRSPRGTNVEFDTENVSYMSSKLLSIKPKKSSKQVDEFHQTESENPDTRIEQSAMTLVEYESLRYLAGYITWKLKRRGDSIRGIPTSRAPNRTENGWIETLSRGGLLIPDEDVCNAVQICEKIEYPTIDTTIVKEFIKVRVKIKVKALNSARKTYINRRKKLQFVASKKI